MDAWALVDIVLILGLAYGIYRKSRICAVCMLIYFVASKIYIWSMMGSVGGLPLAIVLIYYFAQGVAGTNEYHKLSGLSRA